MLSDTDGRTQGMCFVRNSDGFTEVKESVKSSVDEVTGMNLLCLQKISVWCLGCVVDRCLYCVCCDWLITRK